MQRMRAFGCPQQKAAAGNTPAITLPTAETLTRPSRQPPSAPDRNDLGNLRCDYRQ